MPRHKTVVDTHGLGGYRMRMSTNHPRVWAETSPRMVTFRLVLENMADSDDVFVVDVPVDGYMLHIWPGHVATILDHAVPLLGWHDYATILVVKAPRHSRWEVALTAISPPHVRYA